MKSNVQEPESSPAASGSSNGKIKRGRHGTRVVAERYARALLAVALDKKLDLDGIEKDLSEFQELLEREPRLEAALSSPRVPTAKRIAILEEVVKTGELRPESRNLFRLLTENERIPFLPEVSDSFRRLLLEHKQIQPGEVVSAEPLSEEQRARLAKSLGEALGRTMELRYDSDPALLGGVVVRIGNRVFDASVTMQLRRFKEKALSRL